MAAETRGRRRNDEHDNDHMILCTDMSKNHSNHLVRWQEEDGWNCLWLQMIKKHDEARTRTRTITITRTRTRTKRMWRQATRTIKQRRRMGRRGTKQTGRDTWSCEKLKRRSTEILDVKGQDSAFTSYSWHACSAWVTHGEWNLSWGAD